MSITMRKNTASRVVVIAAGWLCAALLSIRTEAQVNDIYPIQAIAGQTAPYSAQNPHPTDIGLLSPTLNVSGKVYGSPGTATASINITPIPVNTTSSGTQYIEANDWPADKPHNLSYMAFGLWEEPSTNNTVLAWVTSGAYVAGTSAYPVFDSTWGVIDYPGEAEAYYTKATSVPKQPSMTLIGNTSVTVDYRALTISMNIEFTDVNPSISLSGIAKLGTYNGQAAQKNTYQIPLSGSGMTGYAVGKLFGSGSYALPPEIGGTFAFGSSQVVIQGTFYGCDTRC